MLFVQSALISGKKRLILNEENAPSSHVYCWVGSSPDPDCLHGATPYHGVVRTVP